MQANHFRAYAIHPSIAKIGGEKIPQKIEEVIFEGDLDDGKASFEVDEPLSQVAFYDHENDGQVCVGRIMGPIGPGRVDIDSADVPEDEPAPETVIIGGVEYSKKG